MPIDNLRKLIAYGLKVTSAVAVAGVGTLVAEAIPARKGVLTIPQPDGTTIEARLHGDEFHHYYTTPDGTPLETDASGFLRRSDTDPLIFRDAMSDMAARSEKRRRAASRMRPPVKAPGAGKGYGLVPGSTFPSKGSPHALILLVEYSDVKFTLDDPHDYFSRMINERGFSDWNATGSAMDFFIENSGGQFTPQFDIVGPVTLANTQSYYGSNGSSGDDDLAYMMVIDGCRKIDAQVDFSKYDNDGDGVIDNVFVFFAGEAESSTGISTQVWPHTYFIRYCTEVPIVLDGVQLDRYACSNEWNGLKSSAGAATGGNGRPDGVGTFVHEFSHVMGLPDLYSTKYNNAFTPGAWSTLDYGPYNNNGCTPPNYSIFERYALGWMQPREIVAAANVRLEDISRNQGAVIPTHKDTEFFLFENRQQEGWDKYIPGHGMLVWHIDFNEEAWTYNMVNNTVAHQYVDIEEADGMGTEETRADDAFPSSLGRTSFTDSTVPSMMPWTGRSVNLPVTDITESADGVITFKVAGGRPDIDVPEAQAASDITPGGFTAHWTALPAAGCTYTLSVYTRTGSGNRGIVYEPAYNHLNVSTATSYAVTGLRSDTQYYYSVCAVVKEGESEPSDEVAVRTEPPTFDYLAPGNPFADDITSTGFTARWDAMDAASEYFITVSTPMPDGAVKSVCDFTGGISGLPLGWSTTASATYAMSGNCGAAVPSLRLSKSGQTLETCEYSDGISGISFWMRGVSTAAGDYVLVEGLGDGDVWSEISRETVSTATGGATASPSIPEGIRAIRLTSVQSKGSIAIDDVTVSHGTAYSNKPLEAYNNLSTGTATSCNVTGLQPETPYVFIVRASDGTLMSMPSEEVSLRTDVAAGISDISAEGTLTVTVNGLTATVSGCPAAMVTAYDVAGRTVATAPVYDGTATLRFGATGTYIIVAGTYKTVKTFIK